ncbi:hypothetical protein C2G38_2155625 [Gigaspora rosea]|uniref:Uncharacterized protein n=1 Tax=Gigaspora rosea TaxID=44941 RepID=A0A397WBR2_9GLOM|nr:hypothetical protein C2G38_2155625 [Gigaspora rosea]
MSELILTPAMGDLVALSSYNDIVLPIAWDIENKSLFIDIDSSGLKKLLIKDPDDYKAAVVQANHPVPSETGKQGNDHGCTIIMVTTDILFIQEVVGHMESHILLLEKEPKNAFELNYRGKLYFIMVKYDEAFEDLTGWLKIEPDNTIALRFRGEINYKMSRYNRSIADLKK